MKKSILLIAGCTLILSVIWMVYRSTPFSRQNYSGKTTVSVLGEQSLPNVTLTLIRDDTIATYSNILAATVFDALQSVTKEKNIPLKTKKYDFGIFIESIGTKPASAEYAWLYVVNGQPGEEAADKKILKTGDRIEWRYMKLTY